eukprot:Hpha_TRINITY_DN15254_c3_g2::TRINITY_DN15254_c3_g2_i1::g.65829::m.65829
MLDEISVVDPVMTHSVLLPNDPKTPGDLLQYMNEPKGTRKADLLTHEALDREASVNRRMTTKESLLDARKINKRHNDLEAANHTLEDALNGVREGMRVTTVSDFAKACEKMIGVQKARKKFLSFLKRDGQGPARDQLARPKMPWWKERQQAAKQRREKQRRWRTEEVMTPVRVDGKLSAKGWRVDYSELLREQERAHGVLVTNDKSYRRLLRKYEGIQALLRRRLSAICRGEELGEITADFAELITPKEDDKAATFPEISPGQSPKTGGEQSPKTGEQSPKKTNKYQDIDDCVPMPGIGIGRQALPPIGGTLPPLRDPPPQRPVIVSPVGTFGLLPKTCPFRPTTTAATTVTANNAPKLPAPVASADGRRREPPVLGSEWAVHGK